MGWPKHKSLAENSLAVENRKATTLPEAVEAWVDVALVRPGCAERTAEIGLNLERTNGSGGVLERVSTTVLQMGIDVV